jgi:hypothetical protein
MQLFILILLLTVIYGLGGLLVPSLSYLKWDNFEFIVPAIIDAHSLWLQGVVPLWTKFVHLGDPLISNGQLGVFYFPHTLTLWLLQSFDIPLSAFPFISLYLHSVISCIAWFLLLRDWKVSYTLAVIASLSIAFGGMLQFNSQIWTDMLPCWAWFSVLLLGCERKSFSVVALAIAMSGMAGHPQQFAYLILFFGLWCLFTILVGKQKVSELRHIFIGAAIGCLLSLPSILPILSQRSYSGRANKLPLEEFLSRGVQWKDFLGTFNPFLGGTQSVMPIQSSTLLFQGFWVLPGILFGLAHILKNRKNVNSDKFMVFFAIGISGLLIAMGGNTPLYAWSYHLPIWSSFRWPFKMLYFCLPLLPIAAAVGWQTASSLATKQIQVVFIITFCVFILSFLNLTADRRSPFNPGTIFFLLGLLSFVFAFLFFYKTRRIQRLSWVLTLILTSVGLIYVTQTNPNKVYKEPYASVGKAELGIDNYNRVLPLTTISEPFIQQNLALMHSGPMNHYESAGGCVTALAPSWRLKALPSDVYGVPERPYSFELLTSNLINTLNIEYVVVGKKDDAMKAKLASLARYKLNKETEDSLVFKNQDVLGKAFFATHSSPDIEENYQNFVMRNNSPSTWVVTDNTQEEEYKVNSKVESFNQSAGTITLLTSASNAAPQLVVISTTWYPSWVAYVNGKKTDVLKVNGTLLGVRLNERRNEIKIKWEDPMLTAGYLGFLAGAMLWIYLCVVAIRVRTMST